jgi:hypothetical protein
MEVEQASGARVSWGETADNYKGLVQGTDVKAGGTLIEG